MTPPPFDCALNSSTQEAELCAYTQAFFVLPTSSPSGNTAWALTASAFMVALGPAIGLYFSGQGGVKSAGNTLVMAAAAMALVAFQWFLFGYSLAYGVNTESIGNLAWGGFTTVFEAPSNIYSPTVPQLIYACLQDQYAAFAASIIAGAIVERMKFTRFVLFIFIWTTIVYDVVAHWIWSQSSPGASPTSLAQGAVGGWAGWLSNGAHSNVVAVDFAGGIVVCVVAGSSGLAAATVLGPRHVSSAPPKPHDVPLAMIGVGFLWFAWLAMGSAAPRALADGVAGLAIWNTQIAASTGLLTWLLLEKLTGGAPSPLGATFGMIAGFAGISSGSGYISYWGAFLTGIICSLVCFLAKKLRVYLQRPDDTLDTFTLFAVGGGMGAFCTGLFANPNVNLVSGAQGGFPNLLGYQLVAVCIAFIYSFGVTAILTLALDKLFKARIAPDEEAAGVDVVEHGGLAYAKEGTPNAMGG